jgi:hypothetical protein
MFHKFLCVIQKFCVACNLVRQFMVPISRLSSMFIISESNFCATHGNNPREYPSSGI